MSRIGIDYGTTNTVVVCNDRGYYPVVAHSIETAVGTVSSPVFPSIAVLDLDNGDYVFGAEAQRLLNRPGAAQRYQVIRSLKRWIRSYTEGRLIGQELVDSGFDPAQVLRQFAGALRASLARSGLFDETEPLEAVLTWPANANGAQRYLTRRCFREAGFQILDGINEPTAAAIEFADRIARGNRTASRQLSTSVAVFDLGGGTFDVSLVNVQGPEFTVLESMGIERLGGDDFDVALAKLFADALGVELDALDPFYRSLILQHARQQKESIASSSVRSLVFAPEDIGWEADTVKISLRDYYSTLAPLLDPALEKLMSVVRGPAAHAAGIDEQSLKAVYLVGGSSLLPLVPQRIAQRFPGVRLILSDKPFTATAMGAAIHSAETVQVNDILSRTFGVIRLADGGAREVFSPIFRAGTRLPKTDGASLQYTAEYSPQHNIGHLQYLECVALDSGGRPAEGIRYWSDTFFPYDPSIPSGMAMTPDQITPHDALLRTRVQEHYTCDPDGVITARLTRCCDGYASIYEIYKP